MAAAADASSCAHWVMTATPQGRARLRDVAHDNGRERTSSNDPSDLLPARCGVSSMVQSENASRSILYKLE